MPVLLDGTPLLRPDELPADIAALVTCQSCTVEHRRLGADVGRLAAVVVELVPELALPDLFAGELPLPPDPLPSELLNPAQRVVDYDDAHGLLAQLTAWLSEPALMSVRLLTGPGGSGKSRLAVELIDAAGEGWQGGIWGGCRRRRRAPSGR